MSRKNKKEITKLHKTECDLRSALIEGCEEKSLKNLLSKQGIINSLTIQELYELMIKDKYEKINTLVDRINTDLKILKMLGTTVVDEKEEQEILPNLRLKYDSKNEKLDTVVVYTTKEIE